MEDRVDLWREGQRIFNLCPIDAYLDFATSLVRIYLVLSLSQFIL